MKHSLLPILFVFLTSAQISAHAECISSHEAATRFVNFFSVRKTVTLPMHSGYMDAFAERNPLFASLFHQGKRADPYDPTLFPYRIKGSEVAKTGSPLVEEIQKTMAFRSLNGVGSGYVVDIPEYFLLIDCKGSMHGISAWVATDGGGDEVVFPPACESQLLPFIHD